MVFVAVGATAGVDAGGAFVAGLGATAGWFVAAAGGRGRGGACAQVGTAHPSNRASCIRGKNTERSLPKAQQLKQGQRV